MAGKKKPSVNAATDTRSEEDRVRQLHDNALAKDLEAAARAACESDGQINPFNAAEIACEALAHELMPPLKVRLWLVQGLADYLRTGGAISLDKTLRLKAAGSGDPRANERALLKRRNEIFASLFQLLTSNGASVTQAAQLIWARDHFLRALAPVHFTGYPQLSEEEKAIETLTKYWTNSWKKKYQSVTPVSVTERDARAPMARLVPYEGGTWAPDAAYFIWQAAPQWGWPQKELAAARKAGLRI